MGDYFKNMRLVLPVAQQTPLGSDAYDSDGNIKPEFLKKLSPIEQFLTAAGTLLSQFRDGIERMTTYSDAREIDEDKLDTLGEQFDLSFSRNISVDRKREIIQDAIDIFRTNGTEKALRRIFRLIGWDVELDDIYSLHPDYYGRTQTINKEAVNYAPIAIPENPTQSELENSFVYGKVKKYEDGVYVDLYDEAGVTYPKYHIYGESYKSAKKDDKPVFIKTPYIRIRVKEEDYQLFTDPYVDENGNSYVYTDTEKFAITQEAITYFLEQSRPANVVIVDVNTPKSIGETYLDETTFPLDGTVISMAYKNATAKYDGTLCYGIPTDRYRLGRSMEVPEYGTETLNVDVPYTYTLHRTYNAGKTGKQEYLPIRKGSSLLLTVPSDAEVRVMMSSSKRIDVQTGDAVWTIQETLSGVTDHSVNIPDDAMTAYINIVKASSTEDITLSID